MKKTKIALFGGSFDPIHSGHLNLLEEVLESVSLDKIVLIPCKQSPHKENSPLASDHQRLEMCQRAVEHLNKVEVSDIELQQTDQISYSWITVQSFLNLYPAAELYWILGTDQWETLETWQNHAYLAEKLTFIVVERQNDIQNKKGFRFIRIKFDSPVSSTAIRTALKNGKRPKGLSAEQSLFIEKHNLYKK